MGIYNQLLYPIVKIYKSYFHGTSKSMFFVLQEWCINKLKHESL